MYFDLTDEQQAIRSTAHDFLKARFKSERIRDLADPLRFEARPEEVVGGRLDRLLLVGEVEVQGKRSFVA